MNTLTEVPGLTELKEDLAEIEREVVLGFTLADAMRIGATRTKQAKRCYINAANNEVCALSAAALTLKALNYA